METFDSTGDIRWRVHFSRRNNCYHIAINYSVLNDYKIKIMGHLLNSIALILVIVWAIGFIGHGVGGMIHILLVIATILVTLRIIQEKKVF